MPKRKITVAEYYEWIKDMEAMATVEGRQETFGKIAKV